VINTVNIGGITAEIAARKQSEILPNGTNYDVLKYVDFSDNGVQNAGYLYLSR
jgi:hypothetical protein